MQKDNILVFPHPPKTAGTTLRERYHHNPGFWCEDYGPYTEQPSVIFGHSTLIGRYESVFPDHNIVYCTALRDPVSRLMSQYNFSVSQLNYMFPSYDSLDFYVWFINKDHFRPMGFAKQYEYLLYNHVDAIKWFDQKKLHNVDHNNDVFHNKVLHWDGETTSTNHEHVDLLQGRKDIVEKNNSEVTFNMLTDTFEHVVYTDYNIVAEFDRVIAEVVPHITPNTKVTVTNETAVTLDFQGKHKYIKFSDLTDEQQLLVRNDMKWDIEFYNKCLDVWRP